MNNKNPVLFLDFDGVLHPDGTLALDEDFKLLDNPQLFCFLPCLSKLLEPHADVRIIVSSDWRRLFDDETLIRLLGPLGGRYEGVVEIYGKTRAYEIKDEASRRGLSGWLALDDHRSVAQARRDGDWRFVATSPALGIDDAQTQHEFRSALLQSIEQ